MFGLMKNGGCAEIDASHYRLHYCGTCKAIGSRYGQLSRLGLNYDVVFLAELHSDLFGADPRQWGSALQAYACYRQPGRRAPLPPSLEIAAAVNVVLAGIKLSDQAEDSGRRRWRWARRLFSPTYRRALRQLRHYGLETPILDECLADQRQLERQSWPSDQSPRAILTALAAPTARLTGEMFRLGAADGPQAAALTAAGAPFGQLVFWLDAWTDQAQDQARGQFNALLTAYGSAAAVEAAQAEIRDHLSAAAEAVATALAALPLAPARLAYYQAKLRMNVAAALHPEATCRPLPARLRAEMSRATLPGLGRRLGWPLRWAREFVPAAERRIALVSFALGFLLLGGMELLGAAAGPHASLDLSWLWATAAGAGSLTGAVAASRWLDRKTRQRCEPEDAPKGGRMRRLLRKKRPWWHWIFITLGVVTGAFLALFMIALLIAIVALMFEEIDCGGGDCDCGDGCCGGCDCGDCTCGGCDCGDCDCGGCDCNCN